MAGVGSGIGSKGSNSIRVPEVFTGFYKGTWVSFLVLDAKKVLNLEV